MDDFLKWFVMPSLIAIGIIFVLGLAAVLINPIKEVDYYENSIKLDAIEYHNEIYLKKGE